MILEQRKQVALCLVKTKKENVCSVFLLIYFFGRNNLFNTCMSVVTKCVCSCRTARWTLRRVPIKWTRVPV